MIRGNDAYAAKKMLLKVEFPNTRPLGFKDFQDLSLVNHSAVLLKCTAWSHLHSLRNNLFWQLASLLLTINSGQNSPRDRNGHRQRLRCCELPFCLMGGEIVNRGIFHATVEKAPDFCVMLPRTSDYRTSVRWGKERPRVLRNTLL